MKNINKYIGIVLSVSVMWSCTYDEPEQMEPTSGSADFSKMVSVGNSLTAGYMNAALYTSGQSNSFPSLLAMQMQTVGGGEFNQPDINSEVGFSGTAMGIAGVPDGTPLGRLRLVGTTPTPIIPGEVPEAFAGDKSSLNNFGVPGITLGTALIPNTGTPGDPLQNGLYTRFASAPGTSTIIGDAAAAMADGGTFFTFWLGSNDVLGYAVGGAANEAILTDPTTFDGLLNQALGAMLSASANANGAVANIPNVSDIPYFTTVPYNSIAFDPNDPVDVGTVDLLNSNFAGFNAALDAIVANLGHSEADATLRKVSYSVDAPNPVLINDEDLEDLGPKFDMLEAGGGLTEEQRAALVPFEQARPIQEGELIVLPAAAVLGTLANPMDQTTVWGVAVPMSDQYILTSTELDQIASSISSFNTSISNAVGASSSRLVLVDINSIFADLVENGASINGSSLDASFIPPFGAFSVDGVHPNQRGYAFVANRFIEAINGKFNSSIPKLNPNNYSGNSLPE